MVVFKITKRRLMHHHLGILKFLEIIQSRLIKLWGNKEAHNHYLCKSSDYIFYLSKVAKDIMSDFYYNTFKPIIYFQFGSEISQKKFIHIILKA